MRIKNLWGFGGLGVWGFGGKLNEFTLRQLSCWSLYWTGSWLTSSVEAMLRWSRMDEKEGRLRGFGSQHMRISNKNPAGTDGGRGSLSE